MDQVKQYSIDLAKTIGRQSILFLIVIAASVLSWLDKIDQDVWGMVISSIIGFFARGMMDEQRKDNQQSGQE